MHHGLSNVILKVSIVWRKKRRNVVKDQILPPPLNKVLLKTSSGSETRSLDLRTRSPYYYSEIIPTNSSKIVSCFIYSPKGEDLQISRRVVRHLLWKWNVKWLSITWSNNVEWNWSVDPISYSRGLVNCWKGIRSWRKDQMFWFWAWCYLGFTSGAT